jgi:hypothetical protein
LHQKALGGLRHALTSCFGRERVLARTVRLWPFISSLQEGKGRNCVRDWRHCACGPRALPRWGRFGSRRRCVVKLAKQREKSVSLRDPRAWTARAGRRPDRRRPSCGRVGGCTNVARIVAETAYLWQALGLAVLRHALVLGRPACRRACRLAGGRGLGLRDGRRVRPRWRRRLCGCRSVWFVHASASAARRHPLLTAVVAGRPHLRTARLRWRLGKSHCGRGRLRNEHQRTDAHDHSDGEHADNATRKI